MMVAAISATAAAAASTDRSNPKSTAVAANHHHHHLLHNHNPARPPLLPSERDNGGGGGGGITTSSRRLKSREVTSRYLSSSSYSSSTTTTTTTTTSSSASTISSSSSRRCPSPLVSRTAPSSAVSTPMPSVLKRSQSVERRRPATPRPTTPLPDSRPGNAATAAAEPSVASKILFTSTRSLSVSFQGESFSLAISKTKAAPSPNLSSMRKGTPERRRATPQRGGGGGDQTENSKPVEQQHRWPARARQVNHLTRSVDFTEEKRKLIGSGAVAAVRALRQSMIDEDRRASFDGRLCVDSSNAELGGNGDSANGSAASVVASDLTASDTESVSSGSNSGVQDSGGVVVRGRNGPRGISVPARFWQETNSRLRRLQEPGSPLSKTGGASKTTATPKLISSRKLSVDSPLSSPRTVSASRGMSSPLRGPARPVSPSKLIVSSTSSPSRGMSSPSRVRNSISGPVASQLGNMPSLLSFSGRGKLGENRIVDAHLLRILYNRHLQWRFVNARADAAMLVQRLTAEKNLYDAWVTMSELRDSVTVKRIKLQLMRQNLKITSILRGQITYLEDWGLLDREHSSSLSGAIEALKASTLRLPVVAGARADIQNVKDAVGSAVNVMQAMASSICSLLSKVEEVNSLVTELANVTRREHDLLYQCKDILSALAAMQVKDCSMRTHILQVKRVPTRNLTTQV